MKEAVNVQIRSYDAMNKETIGFYSAQFAYKFFSNTIAFILWQLEGGYAFEDVMLYTILAKMCIEHNEILPDIREKFLKLTSEQVLFSITANLTSDDYAALLQDIKEAKKVINSL